MTEIVRAIPESAWSKYSIPIDVWKESGNRLYPAWTLVRDTSRAYAVEGPKIWGMWMSTDEHVFIKSGKQYLQRNLFVAIKLLGNGASTKSWTTDNKRYYMETSYGKDSTLWGYWVQWDPSAPQGTIDNGELKTIRFNLDGSIADVKAKQKAMANVDYSALAAYYKKYPAAASRSGGPPTEPPTMPGTSNPSAQGSASGTESNKTAGRSNSPGTSGGNTPTPAPIQPGAIQKITRVETTNNLGVAADGFSVTPDVPYILQSYVLADQVNPNNYSNIKRIFTIDIVPNSFEFSQLASSWSEIDRPGNFSLTDWSKYNLLKVNFKFVISAKIEQGPLDGMKNSIESQLDQIRKIAQAPHPIRLVNCTPYLSKSWKFPFTTTGEEIQFIISDLSVSTTRFTPGGVHEASVAEVTLSLTEYSNPNMGTLAVLPPLKKASTTPGKPRTTQVTNQYIKTTDYLTGVLEPTVGTDSNTTP